MRHIFRQSLVAGAFAAADRFRRSPDGRGAVPAQLDGGGANAGFAAAVVEGYYKDAGLDVTIIQGNGSGNTAQLVANGRAQLAYADAVAVSQLIAKGAPMRIVATVYQSNPNAVMSLKKTGIKSVADLKGKKVGVPSGSSQTTMLPLLLKSNNLKESDINMIDMPVASMVPALLQGQVDAVLGSIDAYQIQAEAQGAQLDVYRFADHGVPTVSTSIFASNQYLKDNPELVQEVRRGEPQGLELRARQPGQDDQGRQGRVPGSEREARRGRDEGDHAALLQRRREVPGQGRGRALDQVAGAPLRGQAAAGRPGSEDVLHQRLPAADEPDARLQVVNYADLHVGLAFRSPGRTITEADVVAFAGLTGDYSELTRARCTARRASSGAASRTECSGSPTRTASCGRAPASCARRRSRSSASRTGASSDRSSSATRSS
jgi:NitT/TauT family transport system substrate-binding protein